nr:tyrosine-type recombinase/integrase [Neobacillus sp. Marseille-Q6967]
MEYVEAIRDIKQIQAMKKVLKNHSERDYLLFVFGINTGLKISELLQLKVSDVIDGKGKVVDYLILKDDEANHLEIYLNNKVKKAIKDYILSSRYDSNMYLFNSPKTHQPITRQQAYRVINDAAREVGITTKIGTHSLRKTFGYHAYKQGVAISLLQKYFHHASSSETLKYIGVSKSENIKTQIDVNL